ncbi:MAG: hypothetical protein IJG06_04285, partial [Clostridia bacterium]|nr:hypothetical protein [Clostridia bacterium]
TSAGAANTYKIFASKGPYTVKATANNDYKVTALTDTAATLPQQEATTSVAYAGGDKTVTATFTAKDKPDWDSTTTAAGATHQKSMGTTDFVYKHTATNDYTLYSALVDGNEVGTLSVDTRTLTATNLDGLSVGEHTVTFTFRDKLHNTDAAADRAYDFALTRKFNITAAPAIDSVTLPTGKKHGDNVGTFAFTIDNGGAKTTYTYTDGTGWDKTVPGGVTVTVANGTTKKADNIPLDTFITNYVSGKIVRYNQRTADTTDETLRNGDSVTVTLGTSNKSATLSVDQKPVELTIASTDNFSKPYDGSSDVKGTLSITAPTNEEVGSDAADLDNVNYYSTLKGTYYDGTEKAIHASTSNRTVKFEVTPNTTLYPDLANYSFTAKDATGLINKIPITVPASAFTIPQAAYGAQPTNQTGQLTGYTGTGVIDADKPAGITIDYKYSYNDTTGTGVTLSDVTATDYAVTVSGDATGSRAAREVTSVVVTPLKGAAESSTYYSSDTPDAKIVINYQGGGQDTYNNIAAALAGNIESVKWGTAATTAGSDDVNTSTKLVVADSGKYIVATVKPAIGSGNTVGGAQITVNKIPVIVTVAANKISKTYDGDATFDGDTVDPSTGFTYSLAVDKSSTGINSTSTAYDTIAVTGTGATVAFKQADVYSATYDGTTVQYSDVAVASNGTISDDKEYTVTQTVSNIKAAEITKKTITVTDITDILPVKQNSTGVISSKLAATNRKESDQTKTGYEATATVPALVGNDYVLFDISYEYADTSASTATNAANVNIRSIALATAASTNKNGNYELSDYSTPAQLATIAGHGTVTERTLTDITLALPTKLQGGVTYGDANYNFTSDADYAGMKVTLQYNDGNVDYTWAQDPSDSTYKWHVVEGSVDKYLADADKPFTLQWSGADLSAAENVVPATPVLWTYNKNGRTMTAAMGSESDAKSVTVNQKELTISAAYTDGKDPAGDTPVKNYDGGSDIKPAGTWTYGVTDGAVTGDNITVAMASEKKVTYSDPNANTDISLLFGGKAANANDIDAFTITVAGDDANNSRAGSYKVKEITGKTTGTINARPVTVTQIYDITPIAQFATQAAAESKTAIDSTHANNSDIKAVFAAPTGSDDEGTGTGLLPAGLSVSFKYQYLDTNTAGALSDKTGTKLAITDITTSSSNYDLQYTPQAATAGDPDTRVEAVGSVTEASVESLTITAPEMFGKAVTDVQYGDIFNFNGLAVAVNFSGGVVETYTPKEYDAGAISKWTKSSNRSGVTDTEVTTVPFTLAGSGGDLPTQGQKLTTVDTDGNTKLKATLKDGEAHTGSTAPSATTATGLVVGP